MRGRFLLKVIVEVLALAAMFSCAVARTARIYSGPQLPRSEICILVCKEGLSVNRIDGKDIDAQPLEKRFELFPGEHALTLELVDKRTKAHPKYAEKKTLKFNCAPGEAYFVSFDVDDKNRKWKPFIFLIYP